MHCFQSVTITIPSRLRSNTFGVGTSGLRVTSEQPIALQARADGDACGAFLVLPVAALDQHYHVVSWIDPSVQAQFGVVAVEDNTVVDIVFPRSNDVRVPYQGRDYSDLEVIRLTLDAYETIQLRDVGQNDLTGTRINASRPIAVFSGNYRTGKALHDEFCSES